MLVEDEQKNHWSFVGGGPFLWDGSGHLGLSSCPLVFWSLLSRLSKNIFPTSHPDPKWFSLTLSQESSH